MNPIAPAFTPRTLATRKLASGVNDSTSSGDSTVENLTNPTTPQTSRRWSDEVASQEEKQGAKESCSSTNSELTASASATVDSNKRRPQGKLTAAVEKVLVDRGDNEEKADESKGKSKPQL